MIIANVLPAFLFIRILFAAIGRLCEKCDGKCVICDSYVRPCTLVRICDECNYGSYQGRCVICGGPGVSDAYYCKECTIQEKDVRIMSTWLCEHMCNRWFAFPERWVSQNRELGQFEDRPFLREKEVRLQAEIMDHQPPVPNSNGIIIKSALMMVIKYPSVIISRLELLSME